MMNPIAAIRKEKGLQVSEFAILSGVSTVTIERIENGTVKRVTPVVLETVKKWGYDEGKIKSDYKKWKEYRLKALESKIEI